MGFAKEVISGDVKAAAQLISRIEDGDAEAFEILDSLYHHTGNASIVGVTGAPGTGKSTLTDNLINYFRGQYKTIGVIAVDPSSAITGGAILGDRVRMQRHSTDPGVFIRSLATRGSVGGLARAAIAVVHVMDALGRDIVLVETVGSGQVEIDIVRVSDTTIVIMNPGAGDEVQTLKAGISESADIFVINKADREGADRLKVDLESMLAMKPVTDGEWTPLVILTEAIHDKGTEEVAGAITRHREFLVETNEIIVRRRARLRLELLQSVNGLVSEYLNRLEKDGFLDRVVDDLVKQKAGPRQSAREIAGRLVSEMGSDQ